MWRPFKETFQKITRHFIKAGLSLGTKIKKLFSGQVNEALLNDFEKLLFEADLGAEEALKITRQLKDELKKKPQMNTAELINFLKTELADLFPSPPSRQIQARPHVILLVGVNGSGKTTSLAKLAYYYQSHNQKVLIAAADTFRAAALEQLTVWNEKLQAEMIRFQPGADPAAVVFDALEAAKSRGSDIVLIDTAGRLQNKTELMQELEKIKRTAGKKIPGAPHEILLTLDATVGQNGLDQAEIFHRSLALSGIILAKFDGTAKGGIIIAIQKKLGLPVLWVGLGEKLEDLKPFDAQVYIEELLD
ncbi:MAG: signal recognition particle-docking protein FtsY [Parachlamydiales bacterium]|jgi:fused signal recognition particle receptor